MVHTFEDLYLRHIEHMVPRARDTSISSLAALTTVLRIHRILGMPAEPVRPRPRAADSP